MAKENGKLTKNWTYDEGKALIAVYEDRKEEYFQTRNKKNFWYNILTDLESLNILVSPTTVEQVEIKWRTLYRAYKNAVDRGTGSTRSKFLYMEEMDSIFHDNTSTSSPHSVSVGVERHVEIVQEKPDTGRKRKSFQNSILEIKKMYYEEKIKEKQKKRELLEKYLENKEKAKVERHREILSILQQK